MRKPRTDAELRAFGKDHIAYEVEQLFLQGVDLLTQYAPPQTVRDRTRRNALVESFAIHARTLTDFFYPQSVGDDDVIADDYMDKGMAWRRARPKIPRSLRTARERTGGEIAHLTWNRKPPLDLAKAWSPPQVLRDVSPLLRLFLEHAAPARISEELQKTISNLGDSSDAGLRFCFETLSLELPPRGTKPGMKP
jgi:hypothetical protein